MDDQSNSISVFDLSGDLQFTINRLGKGEGEYVGISDFLFDSSEDLIYILDRTQKKVVKCNIDGKFINEISERGLFALNMFKGSYKEKVYGILNLDAILFNSESQTINGQHFDENSNPVVYIGKLK